MLVSLLSSIIKRLPPLPINHVVVLFLLCSAQDLLMSQASSHFLLHEQLILHIHTHAHTYNKHFAVHEAFPHFNSFSSHGNFMRYTKIHGYQFFGTQTNLSLNSLSVLKSLCMSQQLYFCRKGHSCSKLGFLRRLITTGK